MAIDKATGALLWKTQLESHLAGDHHAVGDDLRRRRVRRGVLAGGGPRGLRPRLPLLRVPRQHGRARPRDRQRSCGRRTLPPKRLPRQRGLGQLAGRSTPSAARSTSRTGNNYNVPDSVLAVRRRPPAATPTPSVRACPSNNYFDSILAPRPAHRGGQVGDLRAAVRRLDGRLHRSIGDGVNCPQPAGPDYDFGQAPALFTVKDAGGKKLDVVGAGQKSGQYWAVNPDTGAGGLGDPGRPRRHRRRAPVGVGRRRQAGLHRQRQQQPRPWTWAPPTGVWSGARREDGSGPLADATRPTVAARPDR